MIRPNGHIAVAAFGIAFHDALYEG